MESCVRTLRIRVNFVVCDARVLAPVNEPDGIAWRSGRWVFAWPDRMHAIESTVHVGLGLEQSLHMLRRESLPFRQPSVVVGPSRTHHTAFSLQEKNRGNSASCHFINGLACGCLGLVWLSQSGWHNPWLRAGGRSGIAPIRTVLVTRMGVSCKACVPGDLAYRNTYAAPARAHRCHNCRCVHKHSGNHRPFGNRRCEECWKGGLTFSAFPKSSSFLASEASMAEAAIFRTVILFARTCARYQSQSLRRS